MSEPEMLLVPDFSKGPNKIKIDGGCTYDYIDHVVIHNSGPFTDDGCLHTKWQDETALADRVREKYAVEIEQAKQGVCKPEKRIMVGEEKVLADFKEQILQEINTPPKPELKTFEWHSKNMPFYPDLLNLGDYNSWKQRKFIPIEDSEAIHIHMYGGDAIDQIYIPSVDPQRDIISVTLLAEKSLPKDKNDSLDSDYIFCKSRCRDVLVPIKTLTNITSQYVRFAEHPIVLSPMLQYYIKVEFAPEFKRHIAVSTVGLEVEIIYVAHNKEETLNYLVDELSSVKSSMAGNSYLEDDSYLSDELPSVNLYLE